MVALACYTGLHALSMPRYCASEMNQCAILIGPGRPRSAQRCSFWLPGCSRSSIVCSWRRRGHNRRPLLRWVLLDLVIAAFLRFLPVGALGCAGAPADPADHLCRDRSVRACRRHHRHHLPDLFYPDLYLGWAIAAAAHRAAADAANGGWLCSAAAGLGARQYHRVGDRRDPCLYPDRRGARAGGRSPARRAGRARTAGGRAHRPAPGEPTGRFSTSWPNASRSSRRCASRTSASASWPSIFKRPSGWWSHIRHGCSILAWPMKRSGRAAPPASTISRPRSLMRSTPPITSRVVEAPGAPAARRNHRRRVLDHSA